MHVKMSTEKQVSYKFLKQICKSFIRMSHWVYCIVKTSSWKKNQTALEHEKSILISHLQRLSLMKENDP